MIFIIDVVKYAGSGQEICCYFSEKFIVIIYVLNNPLRIEEGKNTN